MKIWQVLTIGTALLAYAPSADAATASLERDLLTDTRSPADVSPEEVAEAIENCADELDPRAAIDGCTSIIRKTIGSSEQVTLAYNNRANAFAALGEPEEALKDYDHAIARNGFYTKALYNRGSLLLNLGRFSEAQIDLAQVVATEACHVSALNNLGLAYLDGGDAVRAVKTLQSALSCAPDSARVSRNLQDAIKKRDAALHSSS